MHSIEELGTNVPAFLAKLWKIVEDPETNDLICWSPSGTSFLIRNQARFSRELLPMYYKHNNMASFVRQLNMYGFHKVVSIEGSGLKVDKDEMEFAHQFFLMEHPYLLEHIKRKIPISKVEEGRTGTKPELMNKVLADVSSMKGRQDSLDSRLSSMKRENEVLWREVAILREKHRKQQQIVNKLIQFLVTMVQSSRNGGIGIKRRYPLMLNDTSHRPSKISKLSEELSNLNSAPQTLSPAGPVIHELDTAEQIEDYEANPEETSEKETFLPSDFCSVMITDDDCRSSTAHLKPHEPPPGSPESFASNPNTEVFFELVDECPLSPSLLLTASPMDVNPVIDSPKLPKGKGRARVSSSKKRRLKRINSKAKTCANAASATPNTSTEALPTVREEGADLLDMVLPTTADLLDTNINNELATDVEVSEDLLNPDSLEYATNAAISAISSVASKNKSLKPSHSLGSRSISKSSLDGILPASNVTSNTQTGTDLSENAMSDGDASSKLDTSDLIRFKPAPSTSSDKNGSPSNMILACTGNNYEEKCFHRSELDSHVDSMQNDLDSLKELLKGEGYSLDANTLLGVCPAIPAFEQDFLKLFGEDPFPVTTFENLAEDRDKQSTGGELATYSTNLLDMEDMFGDSEVGE